MMGSMIVRVLTAHVPSANVSEFNVLLRAQLAELREQPGLVYAKLARRLEEDGAEEVVLFEEWETPADLWSWTGGHLNRPRLLRGTEDLVSHLVITHYEALDRVPWDDLRLLDPKTGLLTSDAAGEAAAGS
jgi:quinol monooxygenase YgiN